jgi:hypothetical protein
LIDDCRSRLPAPAFEYENPTDRLIAGPSNPEASGDWPEHAPRFGVVKIGRIQDRERSKKLRMHSRTGDAEIRRLHSSRVLEESARNTRALSHEGRGSGSIVNG